MHSSPSPAWHKSHVKLSCRYGLEYPFLLIEPVYIMHRYFCPTAWYPCEHMHDVSVLMDSEMELISDTYANWVAFAGHCRHCQGGTYALAYEGAHSVGPQNMLVDRHGAWYAENALGRSKDASAYRNSLHGCMLWCACHSLWAKKHTSIYRQLY
jgi:hypothetical protein